MPEANFLSSTVAHSWSKDGKSLAVTPNSQDVFIYQVTGEDPKKWKKVHTLQKHMMTVTDVDWNHETNLIVTVGQDRNGYVWRLEDNEWKPTLVILRIGHAGTCVKWSPDGNKFAVGSGSKQIPVCHYEQSQDLWVAKTIKKGPKSTVLCVDWSPNNLFLIAGGCDFKCRIFSGFIKNVDNKSVDDPYKTVWGDKCFDFGAILAEFDQCKGWIESVRFSPSGLNFAFTGHDSSVNFGAITGEGMEVSTIVRRDLPLRTIAFLTDTLAIGGGYDSVPIVYEHKGNWEERGPLDEGNSGKKTQKTKSAFGSAFAKFDAQARTGGGVKDQFLPFRHQNFVNDVCVNSSTKFTTSSIDGRVLFWDVSKKY